MNAGQTAIALALLLPIYSTLVVVVARRRRWDQWSSYTVGNASIGAILAAGVTISGQWPAVLGRPVGLPYGIGIVAGAVTALPIIALSWGPSRLGDNIGQAGVGDLSLPALLNRLVVQVLICTVVFEELAFRGVLYVLLASAWSQFPAVAIWGTTASFSLWHLAQLAEMFPGRTLSRRAILIAGGLLAYGLLGLGLALLRSGWDALAVPLVAHATLDVVMICGMAAGRRTTFANQG